MNEVKLSVGPKTEFVHLLRTVVASIAARMNFSLDAIYDLQLAVYEAAAFLLTQDTPSMLFMRAGDVDGAVEAVVWVRTEPMNWPPEGVTDGLAWKILSGLTDRAEFVLEEEGPGIRLIKAGSSNEAGSG